MKHGFSYMPDEDVSNDMFEKAVVSEMRKHRHLSRSTAIKTVGKAMLAKLGDLEKQISALEGGTSEPRPSPAG